MPRLFSQLPTFPQGLLYKQLAAVTWDVGSRTALVSMGTWFIILFINCDTFCVQSLAMIWMYRNRHLFIHRINWWHFQNNLDVVDQQIYYSCCPYLGKKWLKSSRYHEISLDQILSKNNCFIMQLVVILIIVLFLLSPIKCLIVCRLVSQERSAVCWWTLP